MENMKNERKEVLERFLNGEKVFPQDGGHFETAGGKEFLVLTEKEANEKAREELLNSLWAFNADFILRHSKNYNLMHNFEKKAALDALKDAQAKSCESLNGLMFAIIDDINKFIDDAITADGRGHFISFYDGEEHEEELNGKAYFIYRIN